MEWLDIASIVFVCVTMNHLGLIGAIEGVIRHRIPIVNCPKCLSFWTTMVYGCYGIARNGTQVMSVLAISFLASYAAIWLELAEGFIDTLYMKLYGKIYTTSTDTSASDAEGGDSDGTVSDVRQNC